MHKVHIFQTMILYNQGMCFTNLVVKFIKISIANLVINILGRF